MKEKDQFEWLENGNSPQVIEWIKKQNDLSLSEIKNDLSLKFLSELQGYYSSKLFSCPRIVKDFFYFTKREESEERASLCRRKRGKNDIEIILDFKNKKLSNKSLDYWYVSKTGKYIVYGLSENGTEMATLYIYDVNKKRNIDGERLNCRYSQVVWLPEDAGFYYTKNATTQSTPKDELTLHTKIFFHTLHNDFEQDVMIFGDDRQKEEIYKLSLSHDGRYLAIHSSTSVSFDHNEVRIFDNHDKSLFTFFSSTEYSLSMIFLHDCVLLKTSEGAPNKKVMRVELNLLRMGKEFWKDFVSETEFPLQGVFVTKNKVLLQYLVNACAQVKVYNHDGGFICDVIDDEFVSIQDVSASIWESDFFYSTEGFISTKEIRHHVDISNTYDVFYKTPNPINPHEYKVEQIWCVSKDKTRVPIFVIRKIAIQIKKNSPTILYGYGGFGQSQTPYFLKFFLPWLERGGVYAIANIRGGGEFGQKWYTSGIKENKIKSFEDFIASAELLISKGYTNSKNLGLLGGSNGGLLVCSVAILKPEIASAVVARVPLTDMMRFHLSGLASRWTHEYGNPDNTVERQNILKWSPYHNIKLGTQYPHFLFVTGENDSRVNPWHARKMTAKLQASNTKQQVLFLCESKIGHGQGKNKSETLLTQSLILSFLAKKLGLGI